MRLGGLVPAPLLTPSHAAPASSWGPDPACLAGRPVPSFPPPPCPSHPEPPGTHISPCDLGCRVQPHHLLSGAQSPSVSEGVALPASPPHALPPPWGEGWGGQLWAGEAAPGWLSDSLASGRLLGVETPVQVPVPSPTGSSLSSESSPVSSPATNHSSPASTPKRVPMGPIIVPPGGHSVPSTPPVVTIAPTKTVNGVWRSESRQVSGGGVAATCGHGRWEGGPVGRGWVSGLKARALGALPRACFPACLGGLCAVKKTQGLGGLGAPRQTSQTGLEQRMCSLLVLEAPDPGAGGSGAEASLCGTQTAVSCALACRSSVPVCVPTLLLQGHQSWIRARP